MGFVIVYTKVLFLCTEYVCKKKKMDSHQTQNCLWEPHFWISTEQNLLILKRMFAAQPIVHSATVSHILLDRCLSLSLLCVWRQHSMLDGCVCRDVQCFVRQKHNVTTPRTMQHLQWGSCYYCSLCPFILFSPIKTLSCGSNVIYAIKEYVYWGCGATGNGQRLTRPWN